MLSAANPAAAWPTSGDASVAATVSRPLSAGSALRAYWRLLRPGQFAVSAIATVLIAGTYAAYHIHSVRPDAMQAASQPIGVAENEPAVTPAVLMAVELEPMELGTTTFEVLIPAPDAEPPKRASVRLRPVPVPATNHTNAHRRPAPEPRTPAAATPRATHSPAAATVGVPVQKILKTLRPDPWQAMQVSLARCSGDLFARIACDQRVRRHFCEGYWGKAPECASGVVNEHGQ